MKLFTNLLIVGGAGAIGYLAEPSFRLGLTGISPHTPAAVTEKPVMTDGAADEAGSSSFETSTTIDLSRYTSDQLPKLVTIKKDVQVTDSSSDLKMTVPAGTKLKLVRLGEGTLIVGTGAPDIEGEIPIQDTDIQEQLDVLFPSSPSTTGNSAVDPSQTTPQDPLASSESSEEMNASPTESGTTTTPNEVPTTPESPTTPTVVEFSPMAADDIVKVMQDSLKETQMKEISFDQVTEWTGSEPEEIDGKKVNVGTISYKTQTILGLKARQAKAYISEGKVIRWVNPKSGTEIQ